jgi:glycosyltransferase involved in cell wall biosynthesis
MKILKVSNMYPSKSKPYTGVFVQNQVNYLKKELCQDLDYIYMKSKDSLGIMSYLKYLFFFLKNAHILFKKYDLIHVHFFGYHIFLAIFYKIIHPETKLVITFHGSDSINLTKKKFKKAIKYFDLVIGVGKVQTEELINTGLIKNSDTICAGINNKVFYNENLSEKRFDFIFVGNLIYGKGADILIETIKKNDTSARFCIIGNGEYYEEFKKLEYNYRVKVFTGRSQDEIRKYLNLSKFFIFPTRADSFGLVITESIYCGTPVIVSPVSGMFDQVTNGVNGYILDENKTAAWIEAIRECVIMDDEKYNLLVTQCLKSNKQYSLSESCEKLVQHYTKLVDKNKKIKY